jgi:hypothetical protein
LPVFQEYNEITNKYSYSEDAIIKILHILEGIGSNQIVTVDVIPKDKRIKDFLILSEQIERALNIIHKQVREIVENDEVTSGSMFYFSQYGGSKTQFLNLVEDDIAASIPNCVPILIEDLGHVHPIMIFEKMFPKLLDVIGRHPTLRDDSAAYQAFCKDFENGIADIQVSIKQFSNLKRAESILEGIRKVKNPDIQRKLDDLDELLHSSILVDDSQILQQIIKLMQFCTQHKMIFLLLFDEVDLWLSDEPGELKFSKRFNQITNYMKMLLEISNSNVKSYMVFACTDRVNRLFIDFQHKFESTSPAASRLNRLFNSAEPIMEPGNYGGQIEKAMVTIAAYYSLANNRMKIDIPIIEKIIPVLSAKYGSTSRRLANSKMLQLLKNYQVLAPSITQGMREWEKDALRYGRLIQENLPSIFNRLTIKFVREDIPIDDTGTGTRDKLDGYFINYAANNEEIKTFAEVKLAKEFKKEKAYQVMQWLQVNPTEHVIMIIFSPTPLEEIQKSVIDFCNNNGYSNDECKRLHFIHIPDPISFCAIAGYTKVNSDIEKSTEFLDAFTNWLEFFGDLTSQYQSIKREIGIEEMIPIPAPTGEEEGELGEGPQSTIALGADQQTCLNLLSAMLNGRIFTKTGRMAKSKIASFIDEKSLGIADLTRFLEMMKQADIIDNITDKQVVFSSKIINVSTIDDLRKRVTEQFQNAARSGTGSLDAFV